MGVFSRSVRAPTFRTIDEAELSNTAPVDDEEPGSSSLNEGGHGAQLLSAHCKDYPASRFVSFNLGDVTSKAMTNASEFISKASGRPMFLWQSAEVMHPADDIHIVEKGGIVASVVEPQPLDSRSAADSQSDATTPSVAMCDVGGKDEVAAEKLSPWKGPEVKDVTATQLYDNSSPCASTSSSPVSTSRTDSTHDEGSTPCLSETSSPLMNSTTHSTCVSSSVPELMHDKAIEDLTVIGDAAASTETLELLEESFASGLDDEHGGESLPIKPYPTKGCDVGEMAPDVGAAPRETAVASWVRPLQQQMPFIALSTESEMLSVPDPFSVLCHHINLSER